MKQYIVHFTEVIDHETVILADSDDDFHQKLVEIQILTKSNKPIREVYLDDQKVNIKPVNVKISHTSVLVEDE